MQAQPQVEGQERVSVNSPAERASIASSVASTRDIVLVALFAALIAVLGLVPKVDLPFLAGVPITVQTLGVMLAVWQVRRRRWYCVLLEVEVGGERQGLSRCAAALTALPPPYQCLQGTVSGKPYAIVFCLIGTVCNGAMMTFSGKVRRRWEGGACTAALH